MLRSEKIASKIENQLSSSYHEGSLSSGPQRRTMFGLVLDAKERTMSFSQNFVFVNQSVYLASHANTILLFQERDQLTKNYAMSSQRIMLIINTRLSVQYRIDLIATYNNEATNREDRKGQNESQ